MNIYASAIILIVLALLIVILLGPFRLYFSLGKEDKYIKILYKISFLGFTLKADEVPAMEPETEEEMAEEQKRREAAALKKEEMVDKEPGDIDHKEKGIEKERKPSKMPPQREVKLIIDALPEISRILIDLIKSINIRRFFCEISFGLDDPVDTATVSGYLWSIASATGFYGTDILIEPRFDGEQLEGSVLAVLEARILWFVVAAIKALEKEKTRKLIVEMSRGEFF